jgi:hypothetical protein
MLHELGHNLGLRHTDGQGEGSAGVGLVHIPGTPTSDPNSFMRSRSCGVSWTGFSNGDLIALNHLWPIRYFVNFYYDGAINGINSQFNRIAVVPNTDFYLDRSIMPKEVSSYRVFSGWYEEGSTNPWNYNVKITSDVTLYPRWRTSGGFTYVSKDSHGNSYITFQITETTGVELSAYVERGLNYWYDIYRLKDETHASILDYSAGAMRKRIDISEYIPLYAPQYTNSVTSFEHKEYVVLSPGHHWLLPIFTTNLGSQNGPGRGIVYATVKY